MLCYMYGIRDIRFFGEAYTFGCGHTGEVFMGDVGGVAQAGANIIDTTATNEANAQMQWVV